MLTISIEDVHRLSKALKDQWAEVAQPGGKKATVFVVDAVSRGLIIRINKGQGIVLFDKIETIYEVVVISPELRKRGRVVYRVVYDRHGYPKAEVTPRYT